MKEAADKFKGANIYIKYLEDNVDDEKLKDLFSEYGSPSSCKVFGLILIEAVITLL